MQEKLTRDDKNPSGKLHYELTDGNQVVVHLKLLQSSDLFNDNRT